MAVGVDLLKNTVGCRVLAVTDPQQGATIPLAVLYPARGASSDLKFGPYHLEAALNAPSIGRQLPLVLISHGNGGSPWAYRELAVHLAKHGFVVALPEHPGNCRGNNELAGTAANLENRPRHLRLVADAVLDDELLSGLVDNKGYGVIGHSIGGYAALALAGGAARREREETASGKPQSVRIVSDKRVRTLVLLAPATPWFLDEGSLSEVAVPILMKTGDRDEITPEWHARIVVEGVADASLVDHEIVVGAGHFSFMSAFPTHMIRSDFPPSQDPIGFDRTAYQADLQRDIREFLKRTLRPLPGVSAFDPKQTLDRASALVRVGG
jgi:predicted dienelactone hydrolase